MLVAWGGLLIRPLACSLRQRGRGRFWLVDHRLKSVATGVRPLGGGGRRQKGRRPSSALAEPRAPSPACAARREKGAVRAHVVQRTRLAEPSLVAPRHKAARHPHPPAQSSGHLLPPPRSREKEARPPYPPSAQGGVSVDASRPASLPAFIRSAPERTVSRWEREKVGLRCEGAGGCWRWGCCRITLAKPRVMAPGKDTESLSGHEDSVESGGGLLHPKNPVLRCE